MLKRRFLYPFLVIGGILIISVSVVFFRQNNLSQSIRWPPIQTSTSQPSALPSTPTSLSSPTKLPADLSSLRVGSYPEIQRVSVEKAKAALDGRTAVFLDVRGASFYAFSHIPGAINIPLMDIPTRLDELDPDQWIIPYCT